MIDLCHNLGVRLIVEGIETQSQETLLKDMGVKFFQGYLYSRPSKTMGLFSKNNIIAQNYIILHKNYIYKRYYSCSLCFVA
ncbi:EAL domain-containing protein [Photobacterium damselae]|uniref:EAL domain-containing protein n=1 Tax=Photobacterium damselae TaxID=38293 RepID=UPI0039C43F9F